MTDDLKTSIAVINAVNDLKHSLAIAHSMRHQLKDGVTLKLVDAIDALANHNEKLFIEDAKLVSEYIIQDISEWICNVIETYATEDDDLDVTSEIRHASIDRNKKDILRAIVRGLDVLERVIGYRSPEIVIE